ncbi:MAG TPA: ribonuclease R [Pirellulales bacterium]|nr:ribonuclease R [Pirellulales bacterium]
MTEPETDYTDAILAFVLRANYRPLKPRKIAKQLHVPEHRAHEFKRLVKRLVRQGKLSYGEKHLIMPPLCPSGMSGDGKPTRAARDGRISGVFRRNQGGFGFVRPSGTLPSVGREQDVYIAADQTGDAASGDLVLVRLLKTGDRFRQHRGAIVEVIERETHQFVGTYFESGGTGYVQVDGTIFTRPIAVGDPGAKNARADDKVVFEMVRFPTQVHDGEGVITEVLGARRAPGVDTLSIIREFDLPEDFHDDALAHARLEAEQFDESLAGRLDLSDEIVITIDPVDARDFDDAISLRREPNGHWLLGVHIADVSHFVRPGTALDREAHRRGTSVYLPDRVIPMLPEIISNGLASLQPDRVRYTKTAFLEFNAEGVLVSTELASAAIKSKWRFTYEDIDDYLAEPGKWKTKLSSEVHALVARMHELAMVLRRRRFQRGSLELSMQEVKVDLDRDGRVTGAHRVENTVSHQIIEECMLAANEAVAERLAERGWYFLRRVHQSPDPRKLKSLTEFAAALGFPTESLESRFALQELLAEVADKPERQAVNYAVLRSLQRAAYSPEDAGHYALASDCYCHFTSPIRRYPDLTIHRLIDALLVGEKPRNDFGELVALGEHCSQRERLAEEAERELTKVKLLNYLSERIGEELDAVVTGVEQFGLFAQGTALPAEGLIHVTSLADDYYQYDKTTHSLTGRKAENAFRLGDPVRVTVVRVDVERRELDFRLVERVARRGKAAHPSGGKGGGARRAPDGPSDDGGRRGVPRAKPASKKPPHIKDQANGSTAPTRRKKRQP